MLNTARYVHTATLLPNGKVLVAGGEGSTNSLASAELYNVGLGFRASWQPQLAMVTSPLVPGVGLAISGSGFRGVSEASGGDSSQDSPADYPVVQLRSVESGQTLFLLCASWSANLFKSAPVLGLPSGWTLATVFVNGIPSSSSLLQITPLTLTAPTWNGGQFQFTFSSGFGVDYTVKTTTDLIHWSPVLTFSGSDGRETIIDPNATSAGHRLYRVEVGP